MGKDKSDIIRSDTSVIAELLGKSGRHIALLIHVNPDGDAVGSALALVNLYRKLGHHPAVVSPSDYPVFLKWMPGTESLINFKKQPEVALDVIKQADLIFALDFNDLKRVKELNEAHQAAQAYKVLIDHHPDPDMAVDCMISDTSVSSTAELVYRFIIDTGMKAHIDKDVASCIFTGIMTDTGCFSFNSSNRNTWETVAELLDYGIEKDRIYSQVYDNFSANRMRMLGFCLNENMEVLQEYKTGFIWLSRKDLDAYKFEPGDTEGFVNYPLSIRGIRFSALFIEKEDHVRVSLRSKGSFAVNTFSRNHFNGGGHLNASGGDSYLSLHDTISRFKELLPQYIDQLNDYNE
ncbi:MAG: bifunctional oligoribonuclease/PAP phosphatase NrnA [Bacteroidales bacterium]|nr:bifunctional oligoribonuclease/PAP phosphatase NrnA [Bacteroidales bacterium]